MKIIVCIKQVPNTTEIKIDPVTGTLNREGAVSIMNPDDKVGLEFALRLKDKHNAHITVVSMGPMQAKKVLYEALAMGADRALLLTDRLFAGSDSLATSLTLAGLIKTLDYDLIITGRQAIDGDTAQVGPQIAEHLNIPQISYVNSLKYEGGHFVAVRQFEDRYQTLKAEAPLLVTILGDAAEPRSLNVGLLIGATESENIELKGASDIVLEASKLGLKGSPTKVKSTWNKVIEKQRNLLEVEPREAVKAIVDTMKKRHII
ncbi:MAG: electron transfer flavoprotein subunit beta/FixA family protein [Bacilli bacterium]